MSETSVTPSEPSAPELPRVHALVDVFENDEHFLVRADVPGVAKDDVEISFHEGELSFEATRKRGESGFIYRRALAFGDDVDPDSISAKLDDGVLELTLGKAEAHKPRRIAIS